MGRESGGYYRQQTGGLAGLVTKPSWRFWRKRLVKKGKRRNQRESALAALRKEKDRALIELIRRRLALPIEKRMNFLRVRLPGGGSHL